ncbi:MAG: PP2C family protein-serine/threonine phosphatase [Prolixibacteraceae bacterium]
MLHLKGDELSESITKQFEEHSDLEIRTDLPSEDLTLFMENYRFSAPYSFLIVNQQKDILYNSGNIQITTLKLFDATLFSGQETELSKNLQLKNVYLFNEKNKYLAYRIYNEKLEAYLLICHPNKNIFTYLKNYPQVISFIFLIMLAFLISMVIRTNRRYTKPLRSIVMNIQNNLSLKSKGTKTDDLMLIQRSFDAMQNQLEFYIKTLEKSSADKLRIDKDIQIAKRLQRNILPKNIAEIKLQKAFEIYAISEAAFDLGGDFYDYFMLDENHFMFVIADIAGKGIPASLFMIFTHTLLRTMAKPDIKINEIANRLNNKLIEDNISDLFVTMLLGILNTKTGEINYCNAAHNLPVLIRANGIIEELHETHGIPLGIYAKRNYQSSTIQLSPNDQLLFYTDGLIDAKDENGMNFSIDVVKYNLMGAWFKQPKQVVKELQQEVEHFRGTVDPMDDMTLMMLKYTPEVNS